MYRLLNDWLAHWKDRPRRKPLLVRGARQVGKTWSLRHFGRRHFDDSHVVDLDRSPALHRIFEPDPDPHRIVAELEIVLGTRIRPGRSLLFVDEIQACPRAITALRYFHEELPELHLVAAGSLLDFALEDHSVPVGRLQVVDLQPMSFAEFLIARGLEESAQIVQAPPAPLTPAVHQHLLGELRAYLRTGGMPEAVAAYTSTGSFQEAFEVHAELVATYRMDFARYAPRADRRCLDAVLSAAARRVGQQIRYTHLTRDWSIPTVKKALELLILARVITKVPSASPAGLPLAASASAKTFKVVLCDVGLMQHLCGHDRQYRDEDLTSLHQGSVAEQFIGQELIGSQRALHYWSRPARSSSAEVDYLAEVEGCVMPIEVKSSSAGRLRSLKMLLEQHPACPYGLVLSTAPYHEIPAKRLIFAPLWSACAATGGPRLSR